MRILITILLCCYLTATFGISSVEHYCGEDYAGVTFWGVFGNNKCCCSPQKMKKTKNCCKNKHSFSKINTEQNTSVSKIPNFAFLLLATLPVECRIPVYIPHSPKNILPQNHAPPNALKSPIYLICRKLLI